MVGPAIERLGFGRIALGKSPCFFAVGDQSPHLRIPEPIADAWLQVQDWVACETAWTSEPTERHAVVLDELLKLPGVYGNLIPDAHLAALAIEHGLTLCSSDSDFARFSSLRWLNPIGQ
jgi:uncharacterized protein